MGIVASIIIVLVIVSYTNHRISLRREAEFFVSMGQMVKVNGHDLHVYHEGAGELTLVFMSGGGTSAPTLDFKSLYSLLSDKYQIAVVEKAGYGFSELADVDRDLDTLLTETRAALAKAGIPGPYVLFPHSMSGIEALYWAKSYPDEVIAIVGLDMAVPEAYDQYDINLPLLKLSAFVANIGLTRWIPSIAESDAIKYGNLTESEKELYKVIFYRRTATGSMLKEVEEIHANASIVKDIGLPDLPILLFSSNGQGTGWSKEEWQAYHENFMAEIANGELVYLDASHYVHNIESRQIANKADQFIEKYYNPLDKIFDNDNL